MARGRKDERVIKATRRALALITEAMDLMDAHGIAPEAAAHAAMAQGTLRQILAEH